MMNSIQVGAQALNPSLPETLLPSSIDTNAVPQFQAHTDLLGDEPMLANPLEPLQDDIPTQASQEKPHSDSEVEDSIDTLKETLQDGEVKQATSVPEEEKSSSWKDYAWELGQSGAHYAKKAAPYIAGAVAAPVIVTAGVTALGFTAGGIAAGSAAAGLMSLSGGTVAAGGLCAVMQSIGAAGLGTAGTVIASTVGGVVVGETGIVSKIGDAASNIGDVIGDAASNINIGDVIGGAASNIGDAFVAAKEKILYNGKDDNNGDKDDDSKNEKDDDKGETTDKLESLREFYRESLDYLGGFM